MKGNNLCFDYKCHCEAVYGCGNLNLSMGEGETLPKFLIPNS